MFLLAAQVDQLTRTEISWPVALGVVIMTTGLIMRALSRRRQAGQAAPRQDRTTVTRNRERIEEELHGLLIELERLAREVEGQIELRHRKLEVSIRTADERIARLERLLGAAAAQAGQRPPAGETPAPANPSAYEFSA